MSMSDSNTFRFSHGCQGTCEMWDFWSEWGDMTWPKILTYLQWRSFIFPWGAVLETCDLCDLWSEWCGLRIAESWSDQKCYHHSPKLPFLIAPLHASTPTTNKQQLCSLCSSCSSCPSCPSCPSSSCSSLSSLLLFAVSVSGSLCFHLSPIEIKGLGRNLQSKHPARNVLHRM